MMDRNRNPSPRTLSRRIVASLAATAALVASASACSSAGPVRQTGTTGADSAALTTARTDVTNVATAISATQSSGEGNPAALDPSTLTALNIRLSPGSAVGGYKTAGYDYTACVQNAGAWAVWESARGGITRTGSKGNCPAL